MSPANHVNINHDKENDILYVMLAGLDPDKTINLDANANVVVRLDETTKKVVGFIIDGFSKVCPIWKNLKEWELMEKFDVFIEGLNNLHLSPSASPRRK